MGKIKFSRKYAMLIYITPKFLLIKHANTHKFTSYIFLIKKQSRNHYSMSSEINFTSQQPPKLSGSGIMGRQGVVFAHKHNKKDSVTHTHTCSSLISLLHFSQTYNLSVIDLYQYNKHAFCFI